jgi:hypothetical protein
MRVYQPIGADLSPGIHKGVPNSPETRAGCFSLLFTGLAWEEVQRLPLAPRIMRCVDVLLAGRYVAERRVARELLGSTNQTVHLLSPRHTLEEIAATPEAEAVILPDGRVVFSGILPASAAFPLTRGFPE